MIKFKQIILLVFLSLIATSAISDDVLLETYMTEMEFNDFKDRVGRAVAEHPEFKSSKANLRAVYAQLEGSKAALRPQIKVLLDSNNAISRKYRNEASNLVERSQADHKTNVRFSINQLLYDFGASKYEVSMNESLTKASRAELSNKVLELLYLSIKSYIDVASYINFVNVVEDSYLRHTTIKERIQQRVDSGLAAGRELSRAEAREAEAFAKLTSVRQNLGVAISNFRIYFPEGELPNKLPYYPYELTTNIVASQKIMFSRNPLILQANEQFQPSHEPSGGEPPRPVFNEKIAVLEGRTGLLRSSSGSFTLPPGARSS